MRDSRIHHRVGVEGISNTGTLAGSRSRRASSKASDSTAIFIRDESGQRARREHHGRAHARDGRREAAETRAPYPARVRARRDIAAERDIIADTKFEFGYDGSRILLIDEVLTPQLQILASGFVSGGPFQPSFDSSPFVIISRPSAAPDGGTAMPPRGAAGEVVEAQVRVSREPPDNGAPLDIGALQMEACESSLPGVSRESDELRTGFNLYPARTGPLPCVDQVDGQMEKGNDYQDPIGAATPAL